MISSRRLNLLIILGLTLSLVCAGCASKTAEDVGTSLEAPADYPGAVYEKGDATYPAGYYVHTVTLPDESISIIAKWFTGELLNWEVLAKCNPTINPNRIFLGDKIRIPRSIMIRQDLMTPEFVRESQPRPQRKSPSPAKTETEPTQGKAASPADQSTPESAVEEEPFLFGPKGYSND